MDRAILHYNSFIYTDTSPIYNDNSTILYYNSSIYTNNSSIHIYNRSIIDISHVYRHLYRYWLYL